MTWCCSGNNVSTGELSDVGVKSFPEGITSVNTSSAVIIGECKALCVYVCVFIDSYKTEHIFFFSVTGSAHKWSKYLTEFQEEL